VCFGSFIFHLNKNRFEGKYKRRRLYGRPRRSGKDNIERDLKETAWEGMD
jgi:hypothetical protein